MASSSQRKRGCWFWGCATLLGLVVLGGGCIGFGLYQAYQQLYPLTTGSPPELPQPVFPEQAASDPTREAVEDRVQAFQTAVQEERSATLVLTATDLNQLLARHSDYGGQVYVQLKNGQIILQGGLPLDQVPGFQGRYLNGSATLQVSVTGGEAQVKVVDLAIANQNLPEPVQQDLLEQLEQLGYGENLLQDPEVQTIIDQIESLQVEGDQLVIRR